MISAGTTSGLALSSLTKPDRDVALLAAVMTTQSTRAPWFELARVIIEGLDAAADGDESAEIIAAVARASGLSSRIIKRYVVLLRRTREIAALSMVGVESLLSPVFNAQEVAVRLHDRSPETGFESLKELAADGVTLAKLRMRLAEAPLGGITPGERARIAMIRTRGMKRELMEQAIAAACEGLWGKGSFARRRPRLMYVGKNGMEVIGEDGSVVAGIDLMFPDVRLNRDYLDKAVAPALAIAPFFSEFFLAFAPVASDDTIGRAIALIDWLNYSWIGLLSIHQNGKVEVRRKPSGRPSPDMTLKYEALKRKFPASRRLDAARPDGFEPPQDDDLDAHS
jgi:hypothetical protein